MVEQDPERERMILERILGLKQLLKDESGGPVELHELGVCYFLLENYSQASEYLGDLAKTYPDYLEIAAVYQLKSYCLIQNEAYPEARSVIKKRLEVFPDDARMLAMLAFVEEQTGNQLESIRLHRRVIELDPDNKNSLNSLGYLLTVHGDPVSDREEAWNCLSRALKLEPEHPAYLDSLGVYLARQGDRKRAQAALYKALQKHPTNTEIMAHLRDVSRDSPDGSSD